MQGKLPAEGYLEASMRNDRAGWVELCRFIGLFAVIMLHTGDGGWLVHMLWGTYVAWNGLFFLLAAYFMAKKTNSMRSRIVFFLPFYVLWNMVAFVAAWLSKSVASGTFFGGYDWCEISWRLLGVQCAEWSYGRSMPWDYPLWFLRDLMMMMAVFSFLRSRRARVVGTAVLCAAACIPQVNEAAVFYGFPGEQSWWFFCAGILLAAVDLEQCRRFLMRYGFVFVAGFVALLVFRRPEVLDVPVLSVLPGLCAVAAVLVASVWVCAAVPAVGRWCAVFSPVFFFIYASHAIYIGCLSWKGVEGMGAWSSLALLYMAAAALLFRAVARYCPSWAGILFARPMRR